jgi:hypothetical protein
MIPRVEHFWLKAPSRSMSMQLLLQKPGKPQAYAGSFKAVRAALSGPRQIYGFFRLQEGRSDS